MVVETMTMDDGSNLHSFAFFFSNVISQEVEVEKSNIFICDLWPQLDNIASDHLFSIPFIIAINYFTYIQAHTHTQTPMMGKT